MSRNRRIALDYAAGVPAAELAAREGIAPSRVYQIIEKVRRDTHAPRKCAKEELGLLIFRRAVGESCWCEHATANTPEHFYWAELASRTNNNE